MAAQVCVAGEGKGIEVKDGSCDTWMSLVNGKILTGNHFGLMI